MKLGSLKFNAFVTCMVLVIGLSASAVASCGDSMTTMAAVAAGQSLPPQLDSRALDQNVKGPSVVGLWYVEFTANGAVIQAAYQVWNVGGTEIHNPNVDPRGGNVCLGAWKALGHHVYQLTHRVWNYDTNGDFLGTINLTETITLGKGGSTHTGTLALDFYDPSGNFLSELDGTVTGTRIPVQ